MFARRASRSSLAARGTRFVLDRQDGDDYDGIIFKPRRGNESGVAIMNELHLVEKPAPFVPTRGDGLATPGVGRASATLDQPLSVDTMGFAVLHDRLHDANRANPDFAQQFDRLVAVLQTLLHRLETCFGDVIDRVMAVGEWSRFGIDLRDLPYDEVVLLIVLRGDERPLSLYLQIAEEAFGNLDDQDILVQFQLSTLAEWHAAVHAASERGELDALGIPVLSRT